MQKAIAEQKPGSVVLVDGRALRRTGWAELLADWARGNGLDVVAIAPEAVSNLSMADSDYRLAILSLGAMPLRDPVALAWLEGMMAALPATPVVVISDLEDSAEVVAAYRAKARGFVPTSTEPEVALRTLTFIMGGGSFFPPTALFGRGQEAENRPIDLDGGRLGESSSRRSRADLTGRQEEVMGHLAAGLTNKAIAQLMGMRESTVKVHVRQIMRKLGATNRTQAALAATNAVSQAPAQAAAAEVETASPEGAVPRRRDASAEPRLTLLPSSRPEAPPRLLGRS
ncbi:response regulator transcription factor [Teichococcus oryzae]|uniref:Response regulator transcription factor n=1 Tax=Teichococcus oryzae TaxID=1608942 RepID=A0A5B2TD01_9PROT|nr:response regulator transcription factor [Pseudoroseomonas oryzae]KAA2211954.1 response regulator transcription factor [Pseudoroseomonas oryzae]